MQKCGNDGEAFMHGGVIVAFILNTKLCIANIPPQTKRNKSSCTKLCILQRFHMHYTCTSCSTGIGNAVS